MCPIGRQGGLNDVPYPEKSALDEGERACPDDRLVSVLLQRVYGVEEAAKRIVDFGGPEQHLIRDKPAYIFIGAGRLFGLPFSIYIFALVAVVMILLQRRTPLGLLVAAIGDNERAAYLSGHRTRITKLIVYALSGFGAALAGIIQSSQVHTALATYGPFGTELDVIAAVVLGGTSIMGGNGSVARTLLGVFFLGIVNNGMNILNVPIDMQLIAKGAIIVIALAIAARPA